MKRNSETEISGKVDRTFYESETKKCRFNLYKYCMEKYDLCGIVLGHHGDDRAENVLMNIFRGKDILDLFVMTDISSNDGVTLCRPLIYNSKAQIIDFAHEFQIPYLANTTSEKCYRHLMREVIFPAINNFDTTIVDNINLSGIRSKEWKNVVDYSVINPILESVIDLKYGFYMEWKKSFETLPITCWTNIFSEIFHSRGIRMMSNNNLKSMLGWFKRKVGIKKTTNGFTFFFYDEKLYMVKTDFLSHIDTFQTNIDIDTTDTIFSNGWKITVEKVDVDPTTIHNNRIDITDILNGYFTMYIKYVGTKGKIMFTNGPRKMSNYRSFKGIPIANSIPKLYLKDETENVYFIQYRY